MAMTPLKGSDLLAWRRRLLATGGRSVDLDWLLDLGGGLRWAELQKLQLNPGEMEIQLAVPLETLEDLWQRHQQQQVPLQHLVGRCPWRDLELEVTSDALIPRQETELLVDLALAKAAEFSTASLEAALRWADLGTGSGAVAVALARHLPKWSGHAVDCSPQALALARRNLETLAPGNGCELHQGSWWEPLRPWWGALQLVVSNPPYIPASVVDVLDPVVRDHEPRLALDGGVDGLDCCRALVADACEALAPGGWLLLEHHHDQSDLVLDLMARAGLENACAALDLEGVPRFAMGRRAG